MNPLQTFFTSRPSLSKEGVCREAGISTSLLDYILRGQRKLTAKTWAKLLPVLVKYGFKSEPIQDRL